MYVTVHEGYLKYSPLMVHVLKVPPILSDTACRQVSFKLMSTILEGLTQAKVVTSNFTKLQFVDIDLYKIVQVKNSKQSLIWHNLSLMTGICL